MHPQMTSTILLTFSHLRFLDEPEVEGAFPTTLIISMKASTGKSASMVEVMLGLNCKLFRK